MILTRRSFLKELGYTIIGGVIVSWVPKTFYSFPSIESRPLYPDWSGVWNAGPTVKLKITDLWPDMKKLILQEIVEDAKQ